VESPGVVGISDVPRSEEEATPLNGTRLWPDQRVNHIFIANDGEKMVSGRLAGDDFCQYLCAVILTG
jgi:hypothetical protein